jgi:hypothetical protein
MHQVGDQTRLYYDAWSTNHQDLMTSSTDKTLNYVIVSSPLLLLFLYTKISASAPSAQIPSTDALPFK